VYARLKIDNVSNYSFGQNDSGKSVIWAAGKAGWYEISPSDRYLPHYNDTIEAIDLFYFMVDQHQRLPKKHQRLGFLVDPFLTEYQKHTGYRINDDDEAMETIHKHHRFLLKSMIEEREGVDWSETHLYKHLAETYAEEVETLRRHISQMEVNLNKQESEDESTTSSSSKKEESEDESESDEESEATPDTNANTSSNSSSDDSAIDEDWTKTIWDLLNVLRKSPSFNMRECGIEQLAREMVKSPSFPHNIKAARKAIERSTATLLRLMNEAKLRKKFNWSTRTIYNELEATLAEEVAEEILQTPAISKQKVNQKHRMKSVLRPSGAGKARKRTRGTLESQDEDEEMVDPDQPVSSPVARRNPQAQGLARRVRELTVDSAQSREDSPSRQLNGYHDPNALPELPPGPEAQEMLDLVKMEGKRVGRQHQTGHLQAFLEQMVTD
jgi:hypothetical protein